MTAIFGWFGDLMSWVTRWVPRLCICKRGHAGVRFRHGHDAKPIEPGLYVYWPIVTEVIEYPVARQTLNLTMQRLVTEDGKTVVVAAVVVYRVSDVLKALVDSWEVEATIADIALTTSVSVVVTNKYDYLRKELNGKIAETLTTRCREALEPYGIDVLFSAFTDFCPARVISLANDTAMTRTT
jgi:regulator of protease activity HflC (stomatin/prohibitin superfamily)